MADLIDVLHALRDVVASILYPGGAPSGTAPASVVGQPVRILVGWPDASLDADLKANICWVTIWPRPGMARTIGPYLDGWVSHLVTPSMVVDASGDAATFSGTGVVPEQIAAVIVDGAQAYTYPLTLGDGPAEVAAGLAALVSADRPASAAGGVLTVPGAHLLARVVAGGTESREVRRLEQSIQITAWCPTPALRDAIVRAIDDALIEDSRTLVMPDGTKATVSYEGSSLDEEARQQPLHRRDLMVSVEYSTARTRSAPGIAAPGAGAVIKRTFFP
jgi:hypothetical protein